MRLRKRSQVAEMTAEQLHRALVEDFVQGIYPDTLTGLDTQIAAVRKIAEERGQSIEIAFRAVLEEAEKLVGGPPATFDGALH
jgi:hypothetical protein